MNGLQWFWIGFYCTCMVGFSADAVIPDYLMQRAKPIAKPRRNNFKPTLKKCCKIGHRTARKLLTCSVGPQVSLKKSNYVYRDRPGKRGLGKHLARKIERCVSSPYSKMFQKCCAYRAEYYKEIKICKWRHRRKSDRRKCKKAVKKKYS